MPSLGLGEVRAEGFGVGDRAQNIWRALPELRPRQNALRGDVLGARWEKFSVKFRAGSVTVVLVPAIGRPVGFAKLVEPALKRVVSRRAATAGGAYQALAI